MPPQIFLIMFFHVFSQTVCPDWGVYPVSVEAGVTVDQGTLSDLRPFSCEFSHTIALVRCPCAFQLHRLAQNVGLGSGAQHFSCKVLQKIARCPRAFRLHRLAQNVGLGSLGFGARLFSFKFLRKIALVRRPCAFRFPRLAQSVRLSSGARPFFFVKSRIKLRL